MVPDIKTALPGPKAKALIDRDKTVVSPSYTRGYPLVIERGSGATVEDVDGTVLLDCARGFGPLLPGVYHAPYPDRYRCPIGSTPDTCADACIDFIEHQLFTHLVSPDEVAAIVVEPIQGEGGYVVAPPEFLQRLRELTTKHGILLVADEVQSGMGRSGKMFAIEYCGVQPDMIAIAKGIASGLPLGVAAARAGLMAW